MSLFFQPEIRSRCVPGPKRPATGIAAIIRARGLLPPRTRRPLRLRITPDDRPHRTRPRHRFAARERQPVGTAVSTDPGLPGRVAVHRTAADTADPDGERAGAGDLVHLRRPDLAATRLDLRRHRRPWPVRSHQCADHVRRQQGRRVQQGSLRPRRHHSCHPHHLATRTGQRTLRPRRRHAHPPPRRSPSTPREARAHRRREQQADHRPTHPCIEGKTGRQLLAQQREKRQELQVGRDQAISSEARAVAALAQSPGGQR